MLTFARHYELLMDLIVAHCGGSDKFAHTYIGLSIWLAGALVLRKSRVRFEAALLLVVAIELANECVDRVAHGSWMWPDTLGDMAATWFWPALITVSLRCFPRFFDTRATMPGKTSSAEPEVAATELAALPSTET